ncbi:hypothetical protein Acr_14g0006890 [Actinidia rufa]|uniref:Uncharacterized protein n=1 Tax=Actinidia rufa TaxID=165716 RepID=A0A7J0FR52_9ERIC|nr:hypothetical protein Acr_14g0006890 [Actinidia rufa]
MNMAKARPAWVKAMYSVRSSWGSPESRSAPSRRPQVEEALASLAAEARRNGMRGRACGLRL